VLKEIVEEAQVDSKEVAVVVANSKEAAVEVVEMVMTPTLLSLVKTTSRLWSCNQKISG
jgi:hypothetical protein